MVPKTYIYDFLHDPKKHRWSEDLVDLLIARAKTELEDRARAFIKLRQINRERAQLTQQGTEEKTIQIPVKNGIEVYDTDPNMLRVVSVLYDCCFIPHKVPGCDLEITEEKPQIRSYNVSGLPKGKIMISPKPTDTITVPIDVPEIDTSPEQEDECDSRGCKVVEVLCEEDIIGWGLFNVKPRRSIRYVPLDEMEESEPVQTQTTKEVKVELGILTVTYEVAKVLEFPDDSQNIIASLVEDEQLIKLYTCGHLLRDGRDSHSRTLGAEELSLFDARVQLLLSGFIELYDKDNVLEIAGANEGYLDRTTNKEVKDRELDELSDEKIASDRKLVGLNNQKIENDLRDEIRIGNRSRYDVLPIRRYYD